MTYSLPQEVTDEQRRCNEQEGESQRQHGEILGEENI